MRCLRRTATASATSTTAAARPAAARGRRHTCSRRGGRASSAKSLWSGRRGGAAARRRRGAPLASSAAAAASPVASAPAPHCAPLVDGVLLLAVSDRPNQFLCHYFESAALHGLHPTVLGWDDSGWASPATKPWTYHLGAKLVLPLEYLQRCAYPDDALVLFTDHDVVFQGGYADLKAAYGKAVADAGGAPLVFSAETESYPRELKGFYPQRPPEAGRLANYLNSGMWMGPVGGAKALLQVMTDVRRGVTMEHLLRHYHFWGTFDTKRDPIPSAFTENDQVKYAGLYVAQEMAAACNAPGGYYKAAGPGCFHFLHDGAKRCAPGCGAANKQGAPMPRMGLDRSLTLFENVYHAGAHAIEGDGRVVRRGGGRPLVMHFNGPAKVIFEREWGLPWDATAGKTPVLHLVEGLRKKFRAPSRRAAISAFEANTTFLDTWLRRVPGMGPLRYSCDIPW